MKSVFVGLCTALSLAYLLNPTAGILELIPDNIPIIGNIDEALATAMLISAWRYFKGKDSKLFGTKK